MGRSREAWVSGRTPSRRPAKQSKSGIDSRQIHDASRSETEDVAGRYQFGHHPGTHDDVIAPVKRRREGVSRAAAKVLDKPDTKNLPAVAYSAGLPASDVRTPHKYPSMFLDAYAELRALCHDRILFISKFRNLCETKEGFLEELKKWLARRPSLTVDLPSLPVYDRKGWSWRAEADTDRLLTGSIPMLRVRKADDIRVEELMDVLRYTKTGG